MAVSTPNLDVETAAASFPSLGGDSRIAARVNRACDVATEALLYAMVIFSPWAFGTTQSWSISVMNTGGYLLGLLLLVKWMARRLSNWRPSVWGGARPHWTSRAAAALTTFFLLYCLMSALNSRATFVVSELSFTYHEAVRWLPHSYDGPESWRAFWSCLALALSFWAARDWLLTKSPGEEGSRRSENGIRSGRLPRRLRGLLWVLGINGALLAFEGLLQRAMGTNRLLWIIEPWINKTPEAQFGPYAYRSNAAQYLLLAWPVALGFWAALGDRVSRKGLSGRNNLLPCVLIMASAPLFSLSRAAAMIGTGAILIAAALLLRHKARLKSKALMGTACILGLALALGAYTEWQRLSRRFVESSIDSDRVEIWQNTLLIIQDFPLFGAGPGTFGSVYHLYRPAHDDTWHAYAHCDWLELLATTGAVGFACVVALLGLALISPSVSAGIPVPRTFRNFLNLGLGTCLVFAIVDFPFQIYSVLFLFLILSSVLKSVSPRATPG